MVTNCFSDPVSVHTVCQAAIKWTATKGNPNFLSFNLDLMRRQSGFDFEASGICSAKRHGPSRESRARADCRSILSGIKRSAANGAEYNSEMFTA